MDERDREKIGGSLDFLANNSVWSEGLSHLLVYNGVFSTRMMADIKQSRDPARTMFQRACKRGPKAFEGLVQSLIQSNNLVPAQRIKPELQSFPQMNSGGKVWNTPTYAVPPPPVRNDGLMPSRPGLSVLSPANDPPPCIFKDPLTPDQVLQPPSASDTSTTRLQVKKAKQIASAQRYPSCYVMTGCPRGLCLIINNEKFDFLKERRGSTADATNLKALFTDLGFDVLVKTNLSGIELRQQILSFSNSPNHKKAQMTVVVVLSHGGNGYVLGSDGKQCPNEWILEQFNNGGCPDLMGKPKFFIFQACRGDDEDKGIISGFNRASDVQLNYQSTVETDASGFVPRRHATWGDMLIAYATVPGYVANRDVYRGSWFVEAICKVFATHAADKDIREMMDEVSQEMEKYHSEGPNGSMQSSTYEVRGSFKKLFFNPGLYDSKIMQPDDRQVSLGDNSAIIQQTEQKVKALVLFDEKDSSSIQPSSGCKITAL